MQVYELFDGSGPGAYWFWHGQGRKWVVADLDTGVAFSADRMIRFDVRRSSGACGSIDRALSRRRVDGCRVGDTCLMKFDDALPFLRDHQDGVTNPTLFGSDGEIAVPAAVRDIGRVLRGWQEKYKDHS